MTDRFRTQHPEPSKQGVNIDRGKYTTIRNTIESVLFEQGTMSFVDLGDAVKDRLVDTFDSSISWYYTTVKLDLEARGVIERVGNKSPQQIRLITRGNQIANP